MRDPATNACLRHPTFTAQGRGVPFELLLAYDDGFEPVVPEDEVR